MKLKRGRNKNHEKPLSILRKVVRMGAMRAIAAKNFENDHIVPSVFTKTRMNMNLFQHRKYVTPCQAMIKLRQRNGLELANF